MGKADDYRVFARAIRDATGGEEFEEAADYGAGKGYLIDALRCWLPHTCFSGVELDESLESEASTFATEVISWGIDACEYFVNGVDLVCCIEVAEHIPEERVYDLIDRLCDASSKWILFSAAHPGQGGEGHVNEQTQFYWAQKFRERGFDIDQKATSKLIGGLRDVQTCWWLRTNCMLLRKQE